MRRKYLDDLGAELSSERGASDQVFAQKKMIEKYSTPCKRALCAIGKLRFPCMQCGESLQGYMVRLTCVKTKKKKDQSWLFMQSHPGFFVCLFLDKTIKKPAEELTEYKLKS